MKNRMVTMVAGVLMVCLLPLAAFAQQQEWKSTSSMLNEGSTYSSPVTPVGTIAVPAMATTTESYSPAQTTSGPRRVIGTNQDGGQTGDPNSPLGDALIPLMLCACAYFIVRATRRRTLNR